MRDRLILLPGWGLGVSPLEPLAAALQGLDEHLRVEIEPLPELTSSDRRTGWTNSMTPCRTMPGWVAGPSAACWRRNWRRAVVSAAAAC